MNVARRQRLPGEHDFVQSRFARHQRSGVVRIELGFRALTAVVVGRMRPEVVHPEKERAFRLHLRGPLESRAIGPRVVGAGALERLPAGVTCAAHVGEERAGLIARLTQDLGQSQHVVGEGIAVAEHAVTAGIETAKDAGERRPGRGPLGHGGAEAHALSQLLIQVRGVLALRVAERPQPIATQGIDRQQHDIPPGGGAAKICPGGRCRGRGASVSERQRRDEDQQRGCRSQLARGG